MTERVSSPRFVGRVPELERLEAAFKSVAADEGDNAVLLAGEAGVGKTRLVGELATRVRGAGGMVLVGSCLELANPGVPFGPLVQALRVLQRSLDPATWDAVVGTAGPVVARLVPEMDHDGDADSVGTAAVFEHLLGVFERLGERVPTLLVIEDLHWADHSTRDLVVFLARSLRNARVLLLGTFRTDDLYRRHPLRNVLVELDRSGAVERVDLARFDREELGDLITSILGREPSEELVDATFARSDGNAFFAEELLACDEEGTPLPKSLREIVLTRIDALSDAARRVLAVVAVIGPRADDRLVTALADISDDDLDRGLREATEHQVLVTEPAGIAYGFRHALVCEAVYDDVLPRERVRLHARVAEQLETHPEWSDGGPAMLAGEIAGHWYAAHDARRALVAALAAARAAERIYAYPDALVQVERVLELWSRVTDATTACAMRRIEVVAYAADQAHLAGDFDRAVDLIASAIDEVHPEDDPTTIGLLHERWARCLRELGAPPSEILEHVDAATRLVGEHEPAARARVLATRGQQLMLSGRCAEAVAPCEDAMRVAQRVGDDAIVSHALNSLGVSLANLGDAERGLAEVRRSRQVAWDAHSWENVARANGNEASLLASAARHTEALAVLLEGLENARQYGLGRGMGTCLAPSTCEELWVLGRWDEIEPILRDIDAAGPIGVDAWYTTQLWTELSAGRGDFGAAHTHRNRLRKLLGTHSDVRWQLVLTHLDVQLALWQDDLAAALDAAHGFATWSYDGTICPDTHPSTDIMLNAMAAAAKQVGRAQEERTRQPHEQARAVALEFAATFDDWSAGARWGLGRPGDLASVTRQIHAELAVVEGRGDPAEWATLADEWLEHDMQPRAAYARWREAELRVAAGDRSGATDAARDAQQLAETIGWQWLRDGVADLARRARLVVDPDEEPPTPDVASQAGLTRREADVLRLVAEGRTNRQIAQALFISTKTASAHVSSLLTKLGVANRAEAGAAARRLGLD